MQFLNNIDISNKNVLVRLDLDVPLQDGKIDNDARILDTLPTVEFLLKKKANVTIIGHVGRPEQKTKNKEQRTKFQMEPVRQWYQERFPGAKLVVAENLRFDPREEENDPLFPKDIVRRFQAQAYVFDAFAVSHRSHASVVGIPKLLPTAVGFRFQAELEHFSPVLSNPKRPLIFVIGGAKPETKIPLIEKLTETADIILAGGVLPREVNPKLKKLLVAKLTSDSLDISEESTKLFVEKIKNAGTVVWNGPMGEFEDFGHAQGTQAIAKAIGETSAYTLAGGGDTESAIAKFGVAKGIDWISSGGGAMLHYLAYGTLPFLEAISR